MHYSVRFVCVMTLGFELPSVRFVQYFGQVRKVRGLKNMLIREKEQSMLDQMKRAELNRKIMLQEKVKKAQEEELKVGYVYFFHNVKIVYETSDLAILKNKIV